MAEELNLAVVKYLNSLQGSAKDPEAVKAAVAQLVKAFELDADEANKSSDALSEAFKLSKSASAAAKHMVFSDASLESRFQTYLAKLKGTPALEGKDESSPEYNAIVLKARASFVERFPPKAAPAAKNEAAPAAAAANPTPVVVQPPLSPEEYKAKGNDLYKAGDFVGAHEFYTKAINLNPSNAIYYCNRAETSRKLGHFDAVVKDCKEAIGIDPLYTKAYVRLGFALVKLGRYKEAIDDAYSIAADLDPTNDSVKIDLNNTRKKY